MIAPVAPPTAPPDAPTGAATAEGGLRRASPRTVEECAALEPRRRSAASAARPDTLTASREIGPGPAGQSATREDGEQPVRHLDAQGGPAPAGSCLLAVLASYVIPGGWQPAIQSMFLFVQLAVILAALAPRPGSGERLHALGLLGPRHGSRRSGRPG